MKAWLLLPLLVLPTACDARQGLHESRLRLTTDTFVVPTFARDRNGQPYSGKAYGTFFGETSLDCIEWQGRFVDGLPDGEFLIHANCNTPPKTVVFKRGTRIIAANPPT